MRLFIKTMVFTVKDFLTGGLGGMKLCFFLSSGGIKNVIYLDLFCYINIINNLQHSYLQEC